MSKYDITGVVFNRLTVIKPVVLNKKRKWECLCRCGNIKYASYGHLNSGFIQSCGCLNAEQIRTHGLSKTKFYYVWRQMRIRCEVKHSKNFPRYGGRGISVCDRWESFENFYEDMYPSYKEGFSIDRINNDGNYEPPNCRWVTREVNDKNKSTNRLIIINGATKCLTEWANEFGIDISTFSGRLKMNLPYELLVLKTKDGSTSKIKKYLNSLPAALNTKPIKQQRYDKRGTYE